MSRTLTGQDVSSRDAKRVLAEAGYACRYCGAWWASEVDHVRPVAQGGTRDAGNLAAACHRCNAQKSGKTPAAWKAWRTAHGMAWPPPNCAEISTRFFKTLSEEDLPRLWEALRAGDTRIQAANREMLDRHFIGKPRDLEDDRAHLMAQVALFEAERDTR